MYNILFPSKTPYKANCRICGQRYYVAYGGGVCGKNGCKKFPDEKWTSVATDCKIDSRSSRMCEKGTKCCVVKHA